MMLELGNKQAYLQNEDRDVTLGRPTGMPTAPYSTWVSYVSIYLDVKTIAAACYCTHIARSS
jgi:hypothetical protein